MMLSSTQTGCKFLFINLLLVFFLLVSPCLAADQRGPYSFSFDAVPLKSVVFTISDITGANFIFDESIQTNINWIQKDVPHDLLLDTFLAVLSGVDLYTDNLGNNLYSIRLTSSLSSYSKGIGVFPVDSEPEQVAEAILLLYGEKISVSSASNKVIIAGSPETLKNCGSIIAKINKRKSQIESYHLKNISVKSALQSLTDTKMIDVGSFYPDYWHRSIVIRGPSHVRDTVKDVLISIDKPVLDSVDKLLHYYTVEGESLKILLESAVPDLTVNLVGENKVLLTGLSTHVERGSKLIHEIDGTGYQVKVEAVIAYLTDSQFDELGAKLAYSGPKLNFDINNILPGSLITQNSGILLEWFASSFGLTIGSQKGESKGRIIQSPVLTVTSGQEGSITVGQNIPIVTKANIDKNDGNTTGTDITRENVGVTFKIIPQVESNGEFVRLKVVQEVSSVSTESQAQQTAVDIVTDQQRIESTVLVANGDTLFLGGNQTEENAESKTYIPVLGHLLGWVPGVGELLSYKTTTSENLHLIVSLRVTVIEKDV